MKSRHSVSRVALATLAAGLGCSVAATHEDLGHVSAAFSATDVQANAPQVAGDALSNTTAVFPTNKQNEPSITVNPIATQYLVAASNDEQRQPACGPGPVRGASALPNDCSFYPNVGTSGIYTSSNGGKTWTNRGLLDDQPSWKNLPLGARLVSDGDPVLAYGPKPTASGGFSYASGARVYYATLVAYYANAGSYPANKAPEYLAVSYSDDNGVTWSAPVLSTTKDNPNDFNDKESLWIDNNPASPYFGRLYVSWTEFRSAGNGSEPIMVTVSADGGATFSAPKQLSPAGNNGTNNGRQGSVVRSGPDGSVYVAWEQGSAQVVSASRDGGTTWSQATTIAPVVDLADPIPGANFRTDSFPSLAADPRVGSSTLYAAWATRTADGGRIVVSVSNDKGATWSAPVPVSTAAEGYAFYQGLDVAPNGRVDIGYQALKAVNPATFGTGNAAIHAYYVKLANGVWSAPSRITSAASDPAATSQNNLGRQFFGDYNTLVSTNDKAFFIYTDARRGVGCPAVDAYQTAVFGTNVIRGDGADRLAARQGKDPYASDPSTKPAPGVVCPAQFGNSDAYVSVIAP